MKFSDISELLDDGRKLPVVEDFYTVQGEGFHSGRAAYFIRLGGCDVGCKWCDARYTWNHKDFTPTDVSSVVARVLKSGAKTVVITGGEPLIYPLDYLTSSLKRNGIRVFLETSGSHVFSGSFDWVCLSPKIQRPPLEQGFALANEMKVIIASESDFKWAEECALRVEESALLYLQPEWSVREEMLPRIIEYVKRNQQWEISLQTHKYMNIP